MANKLWTFFLPRTPTIFTQLIICRVFTFVKFDVFFQKKTTHKSFSIKMGGSLRILFNWLVPQKSFRAIWNRFSWKSIRVTHDAKWAFYFRRNCWIQWWINKSAGWLKVTSLLPTTTTKKTNTTRKKIKLKKLFKLFSTGQQLNWPLLYSSILFDSSLKCL